MKLMKTEDAVGQVLCHDITQIIKGVTKDAVFRKGHIITEEDIPVLLSVEMCIRDRNHTGKPGGICSRAGPYGEKRRCARRCTAGRHHGGEEECGVDSAVPHLSLIHI